MKVKGGRRGGRGGLLKGNGEGGGRIEAIF